MLASHSPLRHDLNDFTHEKRQPAVYELTLNEDSPESTVVMGDDSTSSGTLTPTDCEAVGTAPDEFYAKALPAWRMAIRRFVMRNLQAESVIIARMQHRMRSPFLDAYFKYMSTLGTHTFFMIALPILFFFGYAEAGRGLAFVLGMGVYASSFIKDLVCAPRPYQPPVSRLTIGSHHLEYGFPSTHSTNSVSMALYIFSIIHNQYTNAESISTFAYSLSAILIAIYIFSIVFGRLYTGMHSMTDCLAGVILGTSIWAAHALWWTPVEDWLVGAHPNALFSLPVWGGPAITILLCTLMVHKHPQPVDDCPCFEDAIAFVSVIAGITIARWVAVQTGYDDASIVSHMPGTPWISSQSSSSIPISALTLWWGTAVLKLTLGITLIFVWRLLAKALMHHFLPALYRILALRVLPVGTTLPTRRFYTPATEYDGPVPEEGGLRPIPSVVDLSELSREGKEEGFFQMDGEMGGMTRRRKPRHGRRTSSAKFIMVDVDDEKKELRKSMSVQNGSPYAKGDESEDEDVVKHYDADVLTKVVVYAGIGLIATGAIPFMFEVSGWGVHP